MRVSKLSGTYDNMVTPDGRFWAGGTFSGTMVAMLDTQTGDVWEVETPTRRSNPARGGFDPHGNAWFAGRGAMLIKLDGTPTVSASAGRRSRGTPSTRRWRTRTMRSGQAACSQGDFGGTILAPSGGRAT